MKQRVAILGSTGSVGKSTLAVLRRHSDLFSVTVLTANANVAALVEQCAEYSPELAVIADQDRVDELRSALKLRGLDRIEIAGGSAALALAASESVDTVMSAIVGAAGLVPTMAAVSAGKKVLIANKEPLVMTGQLFMQEAARTGAQILPIDSEHNAIFQCLPDDGQQRGVKKIHLTASGGPFRGREWSSLNQITPEQACAHPNWSMGQKISVDSATLMNKGLELIEASALFNVPESQVEILVHAQSIIHSMVEYTDGSFLAQLGAPDMKIPIAHALAWPNRIESGADTLDLAEIARLDFEKPDLQNWPCLRLARQAAKEGDNIPTVLNAANEVAVAAFLDRKICFTDIARVIEECMSKVEKQTFEGIDAVLKIDHEVRMIAKGEVDCASSKY